MHRRVKSALAGYRSAVDVASSRGAMGAFGATVSVVRARLQYGIGPFYHSLFGLAKVPVSDWRELLLSHEADPILAAVNNRENFGLVTDKLAFAAHCLRNGLPTIPVIGVIDRKRSADLPEVPNASSADELQRILIDAPDRLFFKAIDGSHGAGAFVAARQGEGWAFAGRSGHAADVYRFCIDHLSGDRGWMVQPAIVPHADLQKIMPRGALGTVRAVTYAAHEGAQMLLPLLRIPAGGNVADNFSNGISGNITAPIDPQTGILTTGRISRTRGWPDMIAAETHPDTGNRIVGFRMPYWAETVNLMLRAQHQTPQLKTLGWDIAVTDAGPLIVEANQNYCVHVMQVAYGRGVRKDLQPVLEFA